jgi:hypothetical protein
MVLRNGDSAQADSEESYPNKNANFAALHMEPPFVFT